MTPEERTQEFETKTMRRMLRGLIWSVFFCGAMVALSMMSLYQDFLGKDGFVKHVQDHWISGWWTVPIALVLLLLALTWMWLMMWTVKRTESTKLPWETK